MFLQNSRKHIPHLNRSFLQSPLECCFYIEAKAKAKQKKHTGENTKAVAKWGQNVNFLANLFDFWGIGSSLGLRASDIILNALHAILEKHAWLWDK